MIAHTLSLFTLELAIAAGFAVLGSAIRGYAGFGANIILAPVFAFLFGPQEAVLILGVVGLISTIPLVASVAKDTAWGQITPMLLGIACITPLGVWALVSLDPSHTRRVIGGLVLAMGLIYLTGWRYQGPRGLKTRIAVGGLAGWLGGFAAIGGPVMVLYFMSGKSNVFTLRANNTISVASLAPFYLVVMWMSGIITPDGVWRALLLVPPYLAGQWVGVRLFHIVSETVFRKFSLFLLIAIGAVTLIL